MNPVIRTGSVEGTAAAINVQLGFVPDYVRIFNYDDAGSLFPTIEWWKGMTDGHALKTKSIADDGTTSNKSSEKITSGGISEYAGTEAGDSPGFTIGTDADMNVTDETIFYVAVRDGAAAN